MKNIVIQGAGFIDNFGDTLFYDIFIKQALKQNVNVTLISPNKELIKKLDSEITITKNAFNAISKTDGLVFIGGGYMGEQPYKNIVNLYRWGFRTIKNILYVGLLAMLFKKRLIVIGVGAGPVTNRFTGFVIRKICNYSEQTVVRDIESYQFLKKSGVLKEKLQVTTDTVLAIDKIFDLKPIACPRKLIVLHLTNKPEKCGKMNTIIKDVERFIIQHPEYELLAVTDQPSSIAQASMLKSLENKFGEKISIYEYDILIDFINQINAAQAVITTKLHVGIVATALKKSVFAIPNHHKVSRFFKQIGASERCLDKEVLKEGDLYKLLIEFVDVPMPIDERDIEKAEMNLKIYKDFIE